MPENGVNTWQKCSERVADLCDDSQWMDGKDCAKEMLSEQEVGEMHDWYRSRVIQMRNNLQIIKSCYQQQRKNVKNP
ncbi:unnamed protein product [Oppiella nova]|uniref:Uncharacterized protein n=1 Tax=Oppiella nova TaxID=334625 RepID=A0A7R9M4T1_9ACAR|nr:unnamed protein product [Oppiella nova]CAG2170785.1 unnamed protein product [Oppiella nova]